MSRPSSKTRSKARSWFAAHASAIGIFIVGFAAMNSIFLAKAFRESRIVDREAAGQLGSFVGGYFGALFALIGVLLLYETLRSQASSFEKQNFEAKYFELLKMHRDNVSEIELQGATGRKVFVLLLRELRSALKIVQELARSSAQQLTETEILHIAYYCLFYGVGPNSSRMLRISLSNFNKEFIDLIEETLNNPATKSEVQSERGYEYTPFEGHQSRLGHYYRHLFQMVRYVDQQPIAIDKYEHVKTIRAQLSTHEQALLLVNSLTPLGNIWWRENLIRTYRMVQNIPRDFFDSSSELDTRTLFDPGYFEWEETAESEPRNPEDGNRTAESEHQATPSKTH